MSQLVDVKALEKYSLIITPLLALRDHLNRNVPKPMLGHWAYTPKKLASLNTQTVGPAEMLLELSKTLGIEAADAALAIIMPAWEELGSLDKVKKTLKSHPQLEMLRKAIDIIGGLPSVWKNRQKERIFQQRERRLRLRQEFTQEFLSMYRAGMTSSR